jgi:ABC-type phosphate transport system auxiliary subunit
MTVPLKILLRTYRGEDLLRTIPIDIPVNASGNLSLVVSEGHRLSVSEQREARLPQPRSVPQLVRALNRSRQNNTLYVKLLGSDPGAVVNGELLPSLPPSVLAVLEADRTGSNVGTLNSATLVEWTLRTEHAISGVRTLMLQVSAN